MQPQRESCTIELQLQFWQARLRAMEGKNVTLIHHIQQPPGSNLCLAACVAMLTGSVLDEVIARTVVNDRGYLPAREAQRYLRRYGLMLDDECEYADKTLPGLLIVESWEIEGGQHAVVWCPERRMVLDPQLEEPREVSEYRVLDWVMVVKATKSCHEKASR